jgi:two-component system, NtrC family, sensor histidine kinase HupT/HoxJ
MHLTDMLITKILLIVSVIFVSVLLMEVRRSAFHQKIGKIMILLLFTGLIWNSSAIVEVFSLSQNETLRSVLLFFKVFGSAMIPGFMLILSLEYAKSNSVSARVASTFFILPVITLLVFLTNPLHRLFYIQYDILNSQISYGRYFYVHAIYSYACLMTGAVLMFSFSLKNSGFFSKQSMLIILGTIFPAFTNIAFTFKLIPISTFATPIAFSVSGIFYAFAIFKFEFARVTPIALQTIVDQLQDRFLILDAQQKVVDFNRSFTDFIKDYGGIKRNIPLEDLINTVDLLTPYKRKLKIKLTQSKRNRKKVSGEMAYKKDKKTGFLSYEMIPIFKKNKHIGTILILRDISEQKESLERILQNEKLLSLGQTIGGIAHNLRTPIMSVSGAAEAFGMLAEEYKASLDEREVTMEDHLEIADEMLAWKEKIKTHLSYMTDVITVVKDQAVSMRSSLEEKFTLQEFLKRLEILTKHSVGSSKCQLKIENKTPVHTTMKGEMTGLLQVLNNLIQNAMDAYEGEYGEISLILEQQKNNVLFHVKDQGKGIPKEVQKKLFTQMFTTKGINGSGLGLYISFSTIRGKFGGNMYFESVPNEGTVFTVEIPNPPL